MLTYTLFLSLILMFILNISSLLANHKHKDREKSSPFECGFDASSKPRMSFSIQFFIISLMFLIFDIEMTLILPMPLIKTMIPSNSWLLLMIFFTLTLISGMLIEWSQGSMNWK